MIADMTLTVPMSWKIIHAFVSSTIRDIHAGGDHLIRDVFPELEEPCASSIETCVELL